MILTQGSDDFVHCVHDSVGCHQVCVCHWDPVDIDGVVPLKHSRGTVSTVI